MGSLVWLQSLMAAVVLDMFAVVVDYYKQLD